MRKEKKIIILVGAIIAVFLLHHYGFISLYVYDDSNYYTGIPEEDINYSLTEHLKPVDEWKGNIESGYEELIQDNENEPIVTCFADLPNSPSQLITAQGTLTWTGGLFGTWLPRNGWYNVYVKDGPNSQWENIITYDYVNTDIVDWEGGTNEKQSYTNFPGGAGADDHQYIGSISFKLKGQYVGALKIEVISRFILPLGIEEWSACTSRDYCYLISGAGKVYIQGYEPYEVPTFELNEDVPIKVECDYSGATGSGNGKWQLWAYPYDQSISSVVIDDDIPDYYRGVIEWTIPDNFWYRGIPDSRVDIVLKNTLFDVAEASLTTIDLRANAPPTPIVTVSDNNPIKGDRVLIDMTAYTNENTHEVIDRFHVRLVNQNNGDEIFYVTTINAQGEDPYQASYEFTAPIAGDYVIQVWAHDVAGRKSVNPAQIYIESHEGQHRLTVNIKDYDTSLPLEGATVTINGAKEKTTNSQGKVWFDLNRGFYVVESYKKGYRHNQDQIQIDKDETITIFLQQTALLWDLTVKVVDTDGNPVAYADVKVGAVTTAKTDAVGEWTFKDIPEGEYTIWVTKNDYSGEKTVGLLSDKTVTITVYKEGEAFGLDLMKAIVAIIIIAIFAVIAFFINLPLPFNPWMNKMIIIFIGVIIALFYYMFL